MAITMIEAEGAQEWIARPNCSLTPAVRRNLIGGVLAASLLVSGGFLLAGAWLVLPFAGLELAVLFLALRVLERADTSFESVRLENERLIVSTHLPAGEFRHSFPAGWARVSLEADTGHDPLVCIRSHGHSAHVGHLMTPAQRRQLASDLANRLAPPHRA